MISIDRPITGCWRISTACCRDHQPQGVCLAAERRKPSGVDQKKQKITWRLGSHR